MLYYGAKNMKIKVTSEKEFILKKMTEITESQRNSENRSYSSTYEYGLTELVRIHMREIAQESNTYIRNDTVLVDEAYERTSSEIKKRTGLDFEDKQTKNLYDNISKKLKYTAKEISQLRDNLETSKLGERIGKREQLSSPETPPFELIEIGLKDKIEGLLALPLIKEFDIDLDRIKESFEVQGDWFPFEIIDGEIVFALDDDGSIFTSTENFPGHVLQEAYNKLRELAQTIYSQKPYPI
jgi:hypothetical protein